MRTRYERFEAVPLTVTVVVGRTRLALRRLSALEPGQLIRLDRAVGTPFDLVAGEHWLCAVEPVASESGVGLKLLAPAKQKQTADE